MPSIRAWLTVLYVVNQAFLARNVDVAGRERREKGEGKARERRDGWGSNMEKVKVFPNLLTVQTSFHFM